MSYGWSDDTGGSVWYHTSYSGSSEGFREAAEAYEEPLPPASREFKDEYKPKTKGMAGVTLHTESTHPVIIITDVTGSMKEWPKKIFSKLPILGLELSKVAPGYALCMGAVGDALAGDRYPLQMKPFASGPTLDEHAGTLYGEGGGGDTPESYGAAAYYVTKHCETPNAVKAICIFILDAPARDKIDPSEIEVMTGDTLSQHITTAEIFAELQRRFTTYIVCRQGEGKDYWRKIVPPQQITTLKEVGDVVEVLSGIVAGELGGFEEFALRSAARHEDRPDRVDRVKTALSSVAAKSARAKSVTADTGKKSKSMKSRGLL